jgi:NhaP-type Na+/H+ or K+/H+ antiporter
MTFLTGWFLAAGVLLLLMALVGAAIERLPFSAAILYLGFGYALGRGGFGLLDVDLADHLPLVEAIAEIGVVLSLFSVGLRLGVPIGDPAWRVPLRLAGPAMVGTIALATVAAWWILGVGWASALLLASIVAPTDPVLASDVQVKRVTERDTVRFGLTAEGGMNDGLAAAGILLALALLAPRSSPAAAILSDVVWALPAGVAVGWVCGTQVGRLALALRRRDQAPEGFEVFLVLGLIALAYGVASLVHAEGFLAVFAAAVALRRIERRATAKAGTSGAAQTAAGTPAAMAHELLVFNRQVERIAEVVVVVLAGALLATVELDLRVFAFAVFVLVVARPVAVAASLAGERMPARERRLLQWFGVRGIGSLYWLAFALNRGAPGADAAVLAAATLALIGLSVLVHGISATPVMGWHLRRRGRT